MTVAETSSRSGGEPAFPSPNESAIAKQLAWAAATSSSGLVFPSDRSVREAHETGSSVNAPLLEAVTLPDPRASVPSQTTSAFRTAAMRITSGRPGFRVLLSS